MTESSDPGVGHDGALDAAPGPEVDAQGWLGDAQPADGPDGALDASEDAFQALASDVRLAVLLVLLRADHAPTFSELQSAVDSDSSAGFAYHLRQLDGRFVRKAGERYELTAADRRAAQAVLAGTFTSDDENRRAS